jgi:hypothetical protein
LADERDINVLRTEYLLREKNMKHEILYRWVASGALLLAGICLGVSLQDSNEALGQGRTPPPAAFQSGGQISVPLLKDISATLHQIDERLARLETVALKANTPGSREQ